MTSAKQPAVLSVSYPMPAYGAINRAVLVEPHDSTSDLEEQFRKGQFDPWEHKDLERNSEDIAHKYYTAHRAL